ncbi:MAG TPA: extensin family protein [Stellaceae bacterium]|nr:extensin family protein [Stellaceae bacterium]
MALLLLRAVLFGLLVASLSGCGHAPTPGESGAACLADLDAKGVIYRPVDMGEPKDPRCRIPTPVKLSRIAVPLSRPVTMSCFLAERLDAFERGALQELAMQDLGRRVRRIDHLGAYSCRASTGRHGQLSEHAYGLAIDISGFRLSDGTLVSVERDWAHGGPKSAFLHHVARAACGYFSVVLTPDSNADHFNHFHLDLGPDRLCSV